MVNQRLTQFIDSAKKKLVENDLHQFRDVNYDEVLPMLKNVSELKEKFVLCALDDGFGGYEELASIDDRCSVDVFFYVNFVSIF